MSKQVIVNQYQKSATVQQVLEQLQHDKNHFQISNLVGSSLSFVISETFKKAEKPFLLIFNDKEGKALNTLCDLISERCLQTGLLVVHTGRESIKLAPPLMIDEEAMMDGVTTFSQAVSDSVEELYGS